MGVQLREFQATIEMGVDRDKCVKEIVQRDSGLKPLIIVECLTSRGTKAQAPQGQIIVLGGIQGGLFSPMWLKPFTSLRCS